jgi:non-ribosomal peptide synthase protein (TIGR01720 family)
LIVDGVSWRILLEEAARAYGRGGEESEWPVGAISFSQWAVSLARETRSGAVDGSRAYWLAEERREAPRLPLDLEDGANDAGSAETLTTRLSKEQTDALLRETPRAYHTQINDVLLTALMESWREWSGERRLLLDLEGHGREDLLPGLECDLSGTVGWFTSIYPVVLELPASVDAGDKLKAIKEQLRKTPDRGLSYGLLRYLRGDGELKRRLEELPQAEVLFNYLGQFEGASEGEELGSLSWERAGEEQSRDGERAHLLEINGHVSEGRLSMSWTWSVNRHRRETIERLAEGFQRALLVLIAHCRSRKYSSFTLSDLRAFESESLNQKDIDEINRVIHEIVT